jgi:hypothetical protein
MAVISTRYYTVPFTDRYSVSALVNARVWMTEKEYALYFSQSTACVKFAFISFVIFNFNGTRAVYKEDI